MDIPVDVPVECTDGLCGRSAYAVLQPGGDQVTHVAVRAGGVGGREMLVSVDLISESTPLAIRLRCSKAELEAMDPVDKRAVKDGSLVVSRGARVEARDGKVGQVDELLVDPLEQQVTHLVLRQGHLWGQRAVTIPASEIDRIEHDVVYLKLDKQGIEALPGDTTRR